MVTFTAPATGPSATFSDTTSTTATATTDVNGVATSPSFTANGIAGAYSIMAAASEVPTPASFQSDQHNGSASSHPSHEWNSATCRDQHRIRSPARRHRCGQRPESGEWRARYICRARDWSQRNFRTTEPPRKRTRPMQPAWLPRLRFNANGISGADLVTATAAGVSTAANFNLTNTAGAPATIAVASGSPQNSPINTAFASPLVALVHDSSSNPVSGVVVTFTAPTTGPTGTFANGTATEIDTTNCERLGYFDDIHRQWANWWTLHGDRFNCIPVNAGRILP